LIREAHIQTQGVWDQLAVVWLLGALVALVWAERGLRPTNLGLLDLLEVAIKSRSGDPTRFSAAFGDGDCRQGVGGPGF
jgi:hypothetical protein